LEASKGLPGVRPIAFIFSRIAASSFDGGLSGSSDATRAKYVAAFMAATWSRGGLAGSSGRRRGRLRGRRSLCRRALLPGSGKLVLVLELCGVGEVAFVVDGGAPEDPGEIRRRLDLGRALGERALEGGPDDGELALVHPVVRFPIDAATLV
jgi:hypothetical protein